MHKFRSETRFLAGINQETGFLKVRHSDRQLFEQETRFLYSRRSQWELPDRTSLDVLESNAEWVHEALATPNMAPNGLPIIALPYLVLMKLRSARTQDLSDISRMMGAATDHEIAQVKRAIAQYLPGALEDLESLIILGQLERKPAD